MLLQSIARLENHTKTSYPCSTFCESTRLRDVFSCSQQENVTVTSSRHMYHICTTSVPRVYAVWYDVCTTSRFGGALKTSLERVHGRYWISVFQVLLQSPERLENLCNTFCESTRLRDVFSCSQQENVTVRSSRRSVPLLYHICKTSVPHLYVCITFVRRLHDIKLWWRITNFLRTCPWQILDKCFLSVIAVPITFWKTTPRRLTYVTLFANPHVFVKSLPGLKRKRHRHVFHTSNGSLGHDTIKLNYVAICLRLSHILR